MPALSRTTFGKLSARRRVQQHIGRVVGQRLFVHVVDPTHGNDVHAMIRRSGRSMAHGQQRERSLPKLREYVRHYFRALAAIRQILGHNENNRPALRNTEGATCERTVERPVLVRRHTVWNDDYTVPSPQSGLGLRRQPVRRRHDDEPRTLVKTGAAADSTRPRCARARRGILVR